MIQPIVLNAVAFITTVIVLLLGVFFFFFFFRSRSNNNHRDLATVIGRWKNGSKVPIGDVVVELATFTSLLPSSVLEGKPTIAGLLMMI